MPAVVDTTAVAGGSERNGAGGGGSSFISGHSGFIAVTSSTDTTPLINSTSTTIDVSYSYHYSGKIFTNTSMIYGSDSMPTHDGTSTMTGNTGNGYAKITFLGQ